jgi:UDP-N-acetylglucosamine/UDP-N-acetylgalactosamine 4-epimerase
MQKTWLITGGGGFIGSNLAQYLLAKDHRVIVIDNLSTGLLENIERVQQNNQKKINFFKCDIRDEINFDNFSENIDVVVHLAAQVSVPRSIDDPAFNHSVNVEGFRNILAATQNKDVPVFIYASSCAVYGDNPNLPLTETDTPRPMSPYAESKLENEVLAADMTKANGSTQAIGLRFFNIFGPWQSSTGGYASVIPKWLSLCMENQQPQLFGDGSATRDFCYIDDICSAIEMIEENKNNLNFPIYNIGNGLEIGLLDLFSIILKNAKADGRKTDFINPEFLAPREGDILRSCANVSRARNDIGFTPQIGIAAGIKLIHELQYQ